MIRILEISPKPYDAMSFYRSRGPLTRLMKEYDDVEIIPLSGNGVFETDIKWSDLANGDILMMQRPATRDAAEIIKIANKMNMPVWVDYDDLLTNVPRYNRAYGYYNRPDVRQVIEEILAMAQVVTVTTPFLKHEFGRYNDHVIVIPNAVDDYLFPHPVEFSDNSIAIWRGGDTHMKDLYVHRDDINKMMDTYHEMQFEFIGYDAPFIDMPGNKIFTPPMELLDYLRYIMSLNPSYNIVALENNDFNLGKSHIGWLESHWAGALSVVPNYGTAKESGWEVYRDDCYSKYHNEGGELFAGFEDLISMASIEKRDLWDKGVEVIREKYVLSKTNVMRHELILDLKAQF